MKISSRKWTTGRRSDFSVRHLLALFIVVGGTLVTLEFSGRFYYMPLCQRYADEQRLTYGSYTSGWSKKGWPPECFFRDKDGNSKRLEISTLQLTSSDWIRWVLSWLALIAGVGGSVWIARLVSPRRRRQH